MGLFEKLSAKIAIKRYDFSPEIKAGPIDNITNVVFYAIDGIGDIIVSSPIIRDLMGKCTGTAYFICSPSSRLYVELLQKHYANIQIIDASKRQDMTNTEIDAIARHIAQSAPIDIIINGLGRVSPLLARLAHLLRPRALLSVMESAKKINKPKMVHNSAHYSNALYRQGVSIVDCWGIITQLIGGQYNRTLLFPVTQPCPVKKPYIALSLTGESRGCLTEQNALNICRAIRQHYAGDIYLINSPSISQLCAKIAAQLQTQRVFISSPTPSLESSGVFIKHAQALVSVCSAPVHIAGAFDTPVMVIRNVSQPEWCPVTSQWEEYITYSNTINEFDIIIFEQILVKFLSKLNI